MKSVEGRTAVITGASRGLGAALAEVFAAKTFANWEAELASHPVIWSPVQTLLEATRDPQVTALDVFAEVDHPTQAGLRTVAPPIELSSHPMKGERPAPALGEHGDEILREAGCSSEEVEAALGSERES